MTWAVIAAALFEKQRKDANNSLKTFQFIWGAPRGFRRWAGILGDMKTSIQGHPYLTEAGLAHVAKLRAARARGDRASGSAGAEDHDDAAEAADDTDADG